ncbi:hypothetical protein R3P38DRAFT_2765132 [Favolaschia claudopus]|uniref:Uncharacterized protein n=1 Tax=Favolaschia claudopus TaxID=2862362 RepID=A0AAW0D5D1_9AGAR
MSTQSSTEIITRGNSELAVLNGVMYGPNGGFFLDIPSLRKPTSPVTIHPCLEHLFTSRNIQPRIHQTTVSVFSRSITSGRFDMTCFICFYQRHMNLPYNPSLDVKGEIVVMRAESDGVTVTDMDVSEIPVVYQVVARPLLVVDSNK